MKAVILVVLLIAAAAILAVERDPIIAEWTATYPSDPALKMSLQLCYIEDRQFNRLSSASRTRQMAAHPRGHCPVAILPPTAAVITLLDT
jgi:hypothetical protein